MTEVCLMTVDNLLALGLGILIGAVVCWCLGQALALWRWSREP